MTREKPVYYVTSIMNIKQETRKQWSLPMSALLSGLFIYQELYFLYRNFSGYHRSLMELYPFHFCSCAAETLNTLKFAQRAKLIQNNVSAILWSVWISFKGMNLINLSLYIPYIVLVGCGERRFYWGCNCFTTSNSTFEGGISYFL